jgi:Arc-like DNA binding domain.
MEKDTTTLRIPRDIRDTMQKEAEEMGISLNSYFLVAANMGRKLLNCRVSFSLDALEENA